MKKLSIMTCLVLVIAVVLSLGMVSAAEERQVLKINVPVTAGSGENVLAYLALHSGGDYAEMEALGVRVPFQAGDKFVYEIAISKAIPGIAAADAQNVTDWTFLTAYLPSGTTDQNGLTAFRDVDLSSVAVNQWYRREIQVPASDFIGLQVYGWYLWIETTGPIEGDSFDIYLKEMKIVHSDNSETIIFDGDNTVKYRAYWLQVQGPDNTPQGVGDVVAQLIDDPFVEADVTQAPTQTPTQDDTVAPGDVTSIAFPIITLISAGALVLLKKRS